MMMASTAASSLGLATAHVGYHAAGYRKIYARIRTESKCLVGCQLGYLPIRFRETTKTATYIAAGHPASRLVCKRGSHYRRVVSTL